MSFHGTRSVWKHTKAKKNDLLVLLNIADRQNDIKGWAFPSIATIAEDTGLSERAVYRSIVALEENGDIEVLRRGSEVKDGLVKGRVNCYRIAQERYPDLTDSQVQG